MNRCCSPVTSKHDRPGVISVELGVSHTRKANQVVGQWKGAVGLW